MKRKSFALVSAFLVLLLLLFYIFSRKSEKISATEQKATEEVSLENQSEINLPPEHSVNTIVSNQPKQTIQERSELSVQEIESIRRDMKITLAAMYGAEKSFYAEYGRYTTDLLMVGYYPESKNLKLKFGFLEPYTAKELAQHEEPRRYDSDQLLAEAKPENGWTYGRTSNELQLRDFASYCSNRCTASNYHFEFMVVAQFKEGNEPEVWTIDDQKHLVQVSNGERSRKQ